MSGVPIWLFALMIVGKLFILLVAHALGDFALQSSWMAKHKNRHSKPDYIPPGQQPQTIWPYVLTSHAFIHGGLVWLLTGSIFLGMLETLVHWVIDFGKCENWYGIHGDQFLHFLTKLLWIFWWL